MEAGRLRPGMPVDPERFDNEELLKRESKGRSFFALQYQLDTSLSDAERYPLRQSDLVVLEVSPLKAPMVVQWGIDTPTARTSSTTSRTSASAESICSGRCSWITNGGLTRAG